MELSKNATCLLLQEQSGYFWFSVVFTRKSVQVFFAQQHHCQSDKKHIYEETRDIPCNIFIQGISHFTSKRQQLLKITICS